VSEPGLDQGAEPDHEWQRDREPGAEGEHHQHPVGVGVLQSEHLHQRHVVDHDEARGLDRIGGGEQHPVPQRVGQAAQRHRPPDGDHTGGDNAHREADQRVQRVQPVLHLGERGEQAAQRSGRRGGSAVGDRDAGLAQDRGQTGPFDLGQAAAEVQAADEDGHAHEEHDEQAHRGHEPGQHQRERDGGQRAADEHVRRVDPELGQPSSPSGYRSRLDVGWVIGVGGMIGRTGCHVFDARPWSRSGPSGRPASSWWGYPPCDARLMAYLDRTRGVPRRGDHQDHDLCVRSQAPRLASTGGKAPATGRTW
jgi:hypothetical protein